MQQSAQGPTGHTLRSVSSTLALEKPMSTMFCTMAGSAGAGGLITAEALFRTADAAAVPVVQSVMMLMTCLVMRKLHLGSLLYDQSGRTALVMVACTTNDHCQPVGRIRRWLGIYSSNQLSAG